VDLREALTSHADLEVVGWSDHVAQAAGVLAGGHLDCVLHGTRSESFPATEIAAIREQTRTPIIVVASATGGSLLDEALNADIADVLVLPQLVDNVVFAIRKAAHAKRQVTTVARHQQGRVITVFSPKGGLQPRCRSRQAGSKDAPARSRPAVR
jgi:PleD family two-component response regulator